MQIVVNMAATREEGEKTYKTLQKACQSFLKFSPPLLGVVRRDKKVLEAIRNQKPVLAYAPHCNAAVDVRTIAKNIL
jgi:flagellar biosynthesis protein FlhG